MSDTTNIQERSRKLTLLERKWLKFYIQTGNKTEAARLAGYDCTSLESFAAVGYQNFKKLHVEELLEEMGLTKKALAQTLAMGIVKPTKKIQKRTIKYKDPTNNTEITEVEYDDIPDWDVRHKYFQDALKIQKMLNAPVTEVNIEEMVFMWGDAPQPLTVINSPPEQSIDKTD